MKLDQVIRKNKTQEDMKRLFVANASLHDAYQKQGTAQIRKGKVGETVVTTIDGEDETKKTVKDGDVVVKGPKNELYVISSEKFKNRYEYTAKELTDEFQEYVATGKILAYEHTGDQFSFIASWDEEMICKNGDYLASPSLDLPPPEVYRIERSIFDKTYSKEF